MPSDTPNVTLRDDEPDKDEMMARALWRVIEADTKTMREVAELAPHDEGCWGWRRPATCKCYVSRLLVRLAGREGIGE